jgi:hypothetical protein
MLGYLSLVVVPIVAFHQMTDGKVGALHLEPMRPALTAREVEGLEYLEVALVDRDDNKERKMRVNQNDQETIQGDGSILLTYSKAERS